MNVPLRRICLTPTKNEAWVIRQFLAAASCWADNIIIADQGSSDGTLEHLKGKPNVSVIVNDSPVYDESYRQRLLIDHSRRFDGKRVLIALDADEALSANCLESNEWKKIAEAEPGTVLRFRWVNILPGFRQAWIPSEPSVFGFVDDGSTHIGTRIHSRRVPSPANAPFLDLENMVVIHFQYVAWDRVVSKHRWYQAWEHLNHPDKGPLQIFRQYHHMYGSWNADEIHPMNPDWLSGYQRAGIDFESLTPEPVMWWDTELLKLLSKYGTKHFRRIAMWDKDWPSFADQLGVKNIDARDPRSLSEKVIHYLLRRTQRSRSRLSVRFFERVLRSFGW